MTTTANPPPREVSGPEPAGSDTRSLSASVRRGALWVVASNLLLRLANVALTAIVARILSPHDFGVFAVALTAYRHRVQHWRTRGLILPAPGRPGYRQSRAHRRHHRTRLQRDTRIRDGRLRRSHRGRARVGGGRRPDPGHVPRRAAHRRACGAERSDDEGLQAGQDLPGQRHRLRPVHRAAHPPGENRGRRHGLRVVPGGRSGCYGLRADRRSAAALPARPHPQRPIRDLEVRNTAGRRQPGQLYSPERRLCICRPPPWRRRTWCVRAGFHPGIRTVQSSGRSDQQCSDARVLAR